MGLYLSELWSLAFYFDFSIYQSDSFVARTPALLAVCSSIKVGVCNSILARPFLSSGESSWLVEKSSLPCVWETRNVIEIDHNIEEPIGVSLLKSTLR